MSSSTLPCSRRQVLCGLSSLSLIGLTSVGQLVACTPGNNVGTLTGDGGSSSGGDGDGGSTGDGGTTDVDTGDTGAPDTSVCDDDNVVCIDLTDPNNSGLVDVGSYGYITVDRKTLIIVHETADTYVCLSAICTHAGCQVQYRKGHDDIYCACHSSYFSMDGTVTGGPASQPLASYETELQGDTLVIRL